jgi:hypothetical protein
MSGSLARLQEAGLVPAEVEEAYAEVLDGLSDAEVDVLVSVGARLVAVTDDVGGFNFNAALPRPGALDPKLLNTQLGGALRPRLNAPLSPIANNDGLIFH